MDKLRRVIIHKSENGYMFSIKNLGHPYSEAAPVNKVSINGPADSAGLRSGDGVVAINSNLVKGKTYSDLCSIIKSSRGTSLELTVIESYCLSTLPQTKIPDDRCITSNNSTPISFDESSTQKYSPILIKKKAYTYDKEALERFSTFSSDDPKSSNSAIELCSVDNDIDLSIEDIQNQIANRYKAVKPKISYKRATNNVYKTPAKSDLDINNSSQTGADSAKSGAVRSKICHYDPTKMVYHQAYKQTPVKKPLNSKSMTDQQQNEFALHNRRGSTPVISDSSSLTVSKGGRYSQTKPIAQDRSRKTSRNLRISKSGAQTSSPVLQLNRVGGLVRAPLSVDETLDLDDECLEDIDSMLNSVDTATTDHSWATVATTESGRSSCDLDTMESSRGKFRHMHCSPMPYKSQNISSNSSMSFEIMPTTELSPNHTSKYEPLKISSLTKFAHRGDANATSNPQDRSRQHTKSYHDYLIDDCLTDKENPEFEQDQVVNHSTKHLKKLKNIFGDNYRGRSKTLDSDGKLKDDEIDDKVQPVSVFVKWITYEGKPYKSSWKQYLINIDDDRLAFSREKSQNYLKSSSFEDVTMYVVVLNVTAEDEPEKRGRKNTIRLVQADKLCECLIEFLEKSTAISWLRVIVERSKVDKDDRESRTASFKERHSLTVPNLFGKEPNQNQFAKSKIKSKDESVSPSQTMIVTNPLSTTSNKSVIHQAMSRVKNLKHKFASSGQVSDFERQQEEWFNKTGANPATCKLVSSFSYSEDIQGGLDAVSGPGQASADNKLPAPFSESGSATMLPLHRWQRSHCSNFVPLVVELCVSIIETFGMNHVGLYRVSGNKVALDFILTELHKPLSDIDVVTDKWNDLHAISGVLKSFFRNLPDGLFPKDLYSDIIGACRMHEFDRERRLLSIQRFLSIMDIAQDHPEYRYHRETLRFLAEHLSRVAGRQSTNKMNAKNLAVVFAPSLMKPPQETNQMLVNDYKYKIQLIETLIKYHKWLFSPSLESACNIPLDSDDEDYTRGAFPSEDQSGDPFENSDSWPLEVTDARPLVKNILARATKLIGESLGNCENSEAVNVSNFTLAELSKQAYAFNSMDGGFKEVDIDEECEKRKGRMENSVLEELKMKTEDILSECSKDIDELNDIQQQCQQSLSHVQLKIIKVNEEIIKTELLLENTKGKSLLSKSVASQLFDIPGRNLSSLSVAMATTVFSQHVPTSESHKT